MMHDDNDDDHVYDGDNYVHDDVLLVYLSLVHPGISGSVITGYQFHASSHISYSP